MENEKLLKFCEILKEDVIQKKSILIFSDSMGITNKIEQIIISYLKESNMKEEEINKYILIFNSVKGTLDEFEDCNKLFLNKCVICSPKVIYGVDILIEYEKVYSIYKYTSNDKFMSSLEYYQQISRGRNTKEVIMFDLNPFYKKVKNYYYSFEEVKKYEKSIINGNIKNHNKNCIKNNIVNELTEMIEYENLVLKRESTFANIYYYKKWFSKLFSNNKMQLLDALARQAGYNIEYKTLNVEDPINTEIFKNIVDQKELLKEVCNKIIDEKKFDETEMRYVKNISEKIKVKMKYLKQFLDNDTIKMDEYNKMLKDEKAFITFINKNYLKMSKKEFNEHKAKANNNELLEFINKNNLYKKIDGLFLLENMLKINRYAINDIPKDIDIKKITKRLIKQVDKLSVFAGDNLSNNKCKFIVINRIEKISHYDQLQKFIADCYNLFGKIILFDKRIIKINKKNITKYFNFR